MRHMRLSFCENCFWGLYVFGHTVTFPGASRLAQEGEKKVGSASHQTKSFEKLIVQFLLSGCRPLDLQIS